ncbi:MAG: FKBP-type peptidyl-prolyl cis-trans isomerase [Phycisphaeraceae bacterium]|nr:FKBP-type peptidyl-prolyl cis-trans isomerase [Phycisphaeraceae bacterium]
MTKASITRLFAMCAVGVASLSTVPAFGQEGPATQGAAQPVAFSYTARWSDAEFGRIADLFSGSWRTTAGVETTDGSGSVEIVMTVTPVHLSEVPDALYVEVARADALHRPYRRAVFQLYRHSGNVRLRTLEFRNPEHESVGLMTGLWLTPGLFPDVPRDSLIATLDVELTRDGEGYKGKTPYPYPTATGGAVEMTSELTINRDRLTTADRGYDASGGVVWGSAGDATYTYARFDHPFRLEDREGGIKVIVMRSNAEGIALEDNDQVSFHYGGWLTNGMLFDSSLRPGGRPLTYQAPGRLIPGWQHATYGMKLGDVRKFILPPEQAYGESGAGNGRIPPNATLVFEVECMFIRRPDDVPAPAGGVDSGHEGHHHDGH